MAQDFDEQLDEAREGLREGLEGPGGDCLTWILIALFVWILWTVGACRF